MHNQTLIEKYPWLSHTNSLEDYLPPDYYNNLLKPYTFNNITDLQLLSDFLRNKTCSNILELGCGNGRASNVVVKMFPDANYTFSDLSNRMLSSAKTHLPHHSSFVVSDAVEFMSEATNIYDLAYTLWSFSHSTHQHFHRLGAKNAKKIISSVIKKFIRKNLTSGGSFFLIHFDSLSQEQNILMKQWKRVFTTFANTKKQSPSKQIIDSTLLELDVIGEITLSINHLPGDVIHYESEDIVLETFMNFHLETFFNDSPITEKIINDIRRQISKYRNNDGSYDIASGCYVYSFVKN